jgi:hypothetical protein
MTLEEGIEECTRIMSERIPPCIVGAFCYARLRAGNNYEFLDRFDLVATATKYFKKHWKKIGERPAWFKNAADLLEEKKSLDEA